LVTCPHPYSFAVRPPACRERWNLVRHAVDRLLAEERVGAGLDIEGEQVAGVFGVGTHWR
jgi:hypothetical protein